MRNVFKTALLGGLIILPRLALSWLSARHPGICLSSDSTGYLELAANWTAHLRFGVFAGGVWIPETVRVPLYPLFLSLLAIPKIQSPTAIAWVQIWALNGVTLYLFHRWLTGRCDARAAAIGILFVGLDLVTLFHLPLILSETFFSLLLVIALALLWRAVRGAPLSTVGVAGLSCGVLALTKPIALYFALPVSLLWLFSREPKRWALFLMAAYLLPGLWIMRNGLAAGTYAFSTQGGMDLLKYPAASVEALRTGRPWPMVYPELQQQADSSIAAGDAGARSVAEGRLALQVLRAHPFLLSKHCALGLVKILGGNCFIIPMQWLGLQNKTDVLFGSVPRWTQNMDILRQHPLMMLLGILYIAFLLSLYGLYAWGLRRLWVSKHFAECYLLSIGPLYFIGLASLEGYCRYRIPAMPFFAAGAAIALSRPVRPGAE